MSDCNLWLLLLLLLLLLMMMMKVLIIVVKNVPGKIKKTLKE